MSKGKTYSVDFVTQFGFLFFNFRDLKCAELAINQPPNGISQSENEDSFSLSSKDNL